MSTVSKRFCKAHNYTKRYFAEHGRSVVRYAVKFGYYLARCYREDVEAHAKYLAKKIRQAKRAAVVAANVARAFMQGCTLVSNVSAVEESGRVCVVVQVCRWLGEERDLKRIDRAAAALSTVAKYADFDLIVY